MFGKSAKIERLEYKNAMLEGEIENLKGLISNIPLLHKPIYKVGQLVEFYYNDYYSSHLHKQGWNLAEVVYIDKAINKARADIIEYQYTVLVKEPFFDGCRQYKDVYYSRGLPFFESELRPSMKESK